MFALYSRMCVLCALGFVSNQGIHWYETAGGGRPGGGLAPPEATLLNNTSRHTAFRDAYALTRAIIWVRTS